jgi:hypothetical protein
MAGEKFESTTGPNGGYTIKVPEGTYRVDVEVREGEVVSKKPDDTPSRVLSCRYGGKPRARRRVPLPALHGEARDSRKASEVPRGDGEID